MADLQILEEDGGWIELREFTTDEAEQLLPFVMRRKWDVVRTLLVEAARRGAKP